MHESPPHPRRHVRTQGGTPCRTMTGSGTSTHSRNDEVHVWPSAQPTTTPRHFDERSSSHPDAWPRSYECWICDFTTEWTVAMLRTHTDSSEADDGPASDPWPVLTLATVRLDSPPLGPDSCQSWEDVSHRPTSDACARLARLSGPRLPAQSPGKEPEHFFLGASALSVGKLPPVIRRSPHPEVPRSAPLWWALFFHGSSVVPGPTHPRTESPHAAAAVMVAAAGPPPQSVLPLAAVFDSEQSPQRQSRPAEPIPSSRQGLPRRPSSTDHLGPSKTPHGVHARPWTREL